jgi:hypothetical protein
MLKERLDQLFKTYNTSIQTLISQVLILEQAHISMDKPHLKNEIDQIISQIASKEVEENRSLF